MWLLLAKKRLRDFEDELVEVLAGLRALYIRNINCIGGLCSPMPKSEPSTMDYIRWLFTEVTDLLEMFADVNKNFIPTAVEGTLMMTGDSIDLASLQIVATDNGADILPAGRDVRKAARAMSRKWWRSFGYDYMLFAIRAKFCEVIAHVQLILL
jgi:hypothetical protein